MGIKQTLVVTMKAMGTRQAIIQIMPHYEALQLAFSTLLYAMLLRPIYRIPYFRA
jgi:hypothetical protein